MLLPKIAALLIACATTVAFANSPRGNHFFYDTSGEKNAISVECKENDDESVICDFFQMTVSYITEPEELQDKLRIENEKLLNEKLSQKDIQSFNRFCDAEVQQQIAHSYKSLEDGFIKDSREKFAKIIMDECPIDNEKKAQKIALALNKIQLEKDSKTCKIWPNHWTETFYKKSTSDTEYWVTKSSPIGECGIINISTLKEDSDFLWDYESTRIVTNPSGDSGLVKCDMFENNRKVSYSWKRKENSVDCKVITFSPI